MFFGLILKKKVLRSIITLLGLRIIILCHEFQSKCDLLNIEFISDLLSQYLL